MPSIENLKKRAKQILRWHRDRHYPVAAQIRAYLPEYENLSDAQVLDSEFQLANAQELVARRLGFESWEALRDGAQTMTNEQSSTVPCPRLIAAEPQLFVADIEASCRYFESSLGFAVAFRYGEPPFYAQVTRDGVGLNLRWIQPSPMDAKRCAEEDLLSATFTVDDVKRLFLEFTASGAEFHQPLRTEPWGARTFIVKDPDGNLLLFAGSPPP
jgi:catechol 2,3-dioxygenase-like lactoylglutathione lyase family enzyme